MDKAADLDLLESAGGQLPDQANLPIRCDKSRNVLQAVPWSDLDDPDRILLGHRLEIPRVWSGGSSILEIHLEVNQQILLQQVSLVFYCIDGKTTVHCREGRKRQ